MPSGMSKKASPEGDTALPKARPSAFTSATRDELPKENLTPNYFFKNTEQINVSSPSQPHKFR